MGRLLVHFHVYYEDQIPWFLEKLGNVNSCEWDLYVTYSALGEASRAMILSAFPLARMMELGNIGYDLWPFIKVLKSVDVDSYDYVMKLHTKAPFPKGTKWNSIPVAGNVWRDRLVEAMLESKECFRQLLERFSLDGKAGLFCHKYFIIKAESPFPEDNQALDDELARIGLNATDRHFCAGTMFLARMAPFRLIRDADLSEEMFASQTLSHGCGSLAHVYERILSFVVSASGYSLVGVKTQRPSLAEEYRFWHRKHITPVLEGIFSLKREGIERVKYLRIFWIRIPLDKGKAIIPKG